MSTTYAYLRVSTDKQDLANQRHEITGYAACHGLGIDSWFEVEVSSRKSTGKRRVDELLTKLDRGDTLIVAELSRLARSMRETLNLMHLLTRKRVAVHLIKENIRTNGESSAVTEMLMANLSFAAQMERELISQRTRAALAQRKAVGVKLGNPRLAELHGRLKQAADAKAKEVRPLIDELFGQGLSQRKVVAALNERGFTAPRGNAWSLVQLQKVIRRLAVAGG